jgi:hypothetical protein
MTIHPIALFHQKRSADNDGQDTDGGQGAGQSKQP